MHVRERVGCTCVIGAHPTLWTSVLELLSEGDHYVCGPVAVLHSQEVV